MLYRVIPLLLLCVLINIMSAARGSPVRWPFAIVLIIVPLSITLIYFIVQDI
jgi:hypothetical protein